MAKSGTAGGYGLAQMENQRDAIRTTHWRLRVNVPAIKGQMPASATAWLKDINTDDDLTVIVKSANLPKITTETVKSWYMGQNIEFPTNTTFENQSTFEVQETSDLIGFRFFGLWHQLVHNMDVIDADVQDTPAINPTDVPLNTGAGKFSVTDFPTSVIRNNGWVSLELYDYTKSITLLRVNYINAFPKEVMGSQLSFEQASLLKWNLVLNHDRYKFVIPSTVAGLGNI